MPNIAKSKLFILQRKHSTEKQNKRTAGTNIYKVLCPALIVHHVFSALFDKFSKRLLSRAPSLYFRLASLSCLPASDSLMQMELAVAGAFGFGGQGHSLEQWRNSKRRWEPRKRSMGMGSLMISPQRGLLLWYSTKEWYALRLGSPEPRLMQSCHRRKRPALNTTSPPVSHFISQW